MGTVTALWLTCGFEAEPYPIDDRAALVEAVEEEAGKIAADAGSDLLESPSESHRELLKKQLVKDMLSRLWQAGDFYKAPDGTLYRLVERVYGADGRPR